MRQLLATLFVITTAALAGCGADEAAEPAGENLVDAGAADAREQNTFELAGIDYRVALFRQLNPRIRADAALYDGELAREDAAVFAAFVRACNESDDERTPTSRIALEDAFGERYPQLEDAATRAFGYRPRSLDPGQCLPRPGSAADRAYPGAVLLYAIPNDKLGNRPFVLEFHDPAAEGTSTVRVELDL